MSTSIGFIAFYGLTPSINFFEQSGIDFKNSDDRDLHVLLSEVGDVRHILKTLADALPLPNGPKQHVLNIYLHDK